MAMRWGVCEYIPGREPFLVIRRSLAGFRCGHIFPSYISVDEKGKRKRMGGARRVEEAGRLGHIVAFHKPHQLDIMQSYFL